jgi:hypothetical protein
MKVVAVLALVPAMLVEVLAMAALLLHYIYLDSLLQPLF